MNQINRLAAVLFRALFLVATCCLTPVLYGQADTGDECTITDQDLDEAAANVNLLHTTLMQAMQGADQLGYTGRYSLIEPVIRARFNTPLITRTILGRRYWDSLSPAQMQDFETTFQQLSIATYADRFDGYEGEEFVEVEKKSLPTRGDCQASAGHEPPARRIIVKTELRQPGDDPVSLEYLQQEIDGNWYIITVIADGVNDLSLKRGEYTDVIRQRGFESLMDDLRQKIREMEK